MIIPLTDMFPLTLMHISKKINSTWDEYVILFTLCLDYSIFIIILIIIKHTLDYTKFNRNVNINYYS